jgi:hypothetical protein
VRTFLAFSVCVLPLLWETEFHTYKNGIIVFYILKFMCLYSRQKEISALRMKMKKTESRKQIKTNSFLSHALKPKVVCELIYGEWNCRIIDAVGMLPLLAKKVLDHLKSRWKSAWNSFLLSVCSHHVFACSRLKSASLYSSHKVAREFYAKRAHMAIEIVVVYNALFALNDLPTGIPLPSASP